MCRSTQFKHRAVGYSWGHTHVHVYTSVGISHRLQYSVWANITKMSANIQREVFSDFMEVFWQHFDIEAKFTSLKTGMILKSETLLM